MMRALPGAALAVLCRRLFGSSTQFEARTILTGTLKVATAGGGEFVLVTLKK